MVKNTEFDPNEYVSSPFTAPETRATPVAETPAVEAEVEVVSTDESPAVETDAAVEAKPAFEPIVLENPMQLVFRPPAPEYIPIRSGRPMDDEGPSVRRRTRGNRVERSERVERVYIEPEQITEPQRIRGSTRIEAKRQRRRDSRDVGRRRPVVTE